MADSNQELIKRTRTHVYTNSSSSHTRVDSDFAVCKMRFVLWLAVVGSLPGSLVGGCVCVLFSIVNVYLLC